jgi:hypothetical protein
MITDARLPTLYTVYRYHVDCQLYCYVLLCDRFEPRYIAVRILQSATFVGLELAVVAEYNY